MAEDRTPIDPLGRLMLAFDGLELPAAMADRLASAPAAGVTLFRYRNSETPAQVRALSAALQAAAARFDPASAARKPFCYAHNSNNIMTFSQLR